MVVIHCLLVVVVVYSMEIVYYVVVVALCSMSGRYRFSVAGADWLGWLSGRSGGKQQGGALHT